MLKKGCLLVYLLSVTFTSQGYSEINAKGLTEIRNKEIKAQAFNLLLGHGVGGFIQGNTSAGIIFLVSDLVLSSAIGFSTIQLGIDSSKPYLSPSEKPALVVISISSLTLAAISRISQMIATGEFARSQRKGLTHTPLASWGLGLTPGSVNVSATFRY